MMIRLLPILGWCLACLPFNSMATETGAGVSPGALTWYGSQWMFRDAFAHSAPWRSSDKSLPLEVDEEGWVRRLAPGQSASTTIYHGAAPHYPGGRYIARYEGEGRLQFSGAATVVQSEPGQLLLDIDPASGPIDIELLATDAADPLRHLQLVPEGLLDGLEANPFHPRFLEILEPFGVIRFTHLMHGGDSDPVDWETRVTPKHRTQAGKGGIALEYAIELCNALDADAWFTMRVAADAEYMRAFAEMVKERLEPDRRVYVEYGDDVGVWPTKSSQYCIEKGRALDLAEDAGTARSRYYALRSAELFTIWNDVFENHPRLITVLNPIDEEACTYAEAADGADAAGIVTLFGQDFGKLPNIDHLLSTDLETLMDELEQVASVNEGVREAITRARKFNLQPVSFYMTPIICPLGPIEKERGKETQQAVEARTLAMLEHPRMEPIFDQFIRSWHEAGGGLWIHEGLVAKPSRWGWFGLLKQMNEHPQESPKFRAVLDTIDTQNP